MLPSEPAAGWQLTVRSKATGKVVDTRRGGEARGELKVDWYGTTANGRLPNGGYGWALSVDPADGVGAPLQVQGSVQVRKGAATATRWAASGACRTASVTC